MAHLWGYFFRQLDEFHIVTLSSGTNQVIVNVSGQHIGVALGVHVPIYGVELVLKSALLIIRQGGQVRAADSR
jgi:hypothetical protein